jgi:hypothetical protein
MCSAMSAYMSQGLGLECMRMTRNQCRRLHFLKLSSQPHHQRWWGPPLCSRAAEGPRAAERGVACAAGGGAPRDPLGPRAAVAPGTERGAMPQPARRQREERRRSLAALAEAGEQPRACAAVVHGAPPRHPPLPPLSAAAARRALLLRPPPRPRRRRPRSWLLLLLSLSPGRGAGHRPASVGPWGRPT